MIDQTLARILERITAIERNLERTAVSEIAQGGGISGSGVANQLAYWSGVNTITGSAAFTVSNNNYLELSISSTGNPRGLVVTETGGAGAQVWIRRNSGSAVTSGQTIGVYVFDGWDGSAYSFLSGGASIAAVAGENWSGTARGTLLSLRATKNTTTTLAERFRIGSDGNILMTNDPDLSCVFNANSAGGIGQFIFVQNSVNQWFMRMNATADFDWVDSAGSQVIFLQQTNQNIGLGGANSFGTSATRTITHLSGTAPGSNVGDSYQQYSNDIVAGNAAPHFRTENGTVIKLYQVSSGWTITNLTTDRAYDANATSVAELADALGTLIEDLKNTGIIAS